MAVVVKVGPSVQLKGFQLNSNKEEEEEGRVGDQRLSCKEVMVEETIKDKVVEHNHLVKCHSSSNMP